MVAALLVTVGYGAIGFLDDYLKLQQKRRGEKNRGLVERYKLAGQITIGVALGCYLWLYPISNLPGASTTLPFFKYVLVVPAAALRLGLGRAAANEFALASQRALPKKLVDAGYVHAYPHLGDALSAAISPLAPR